MSPNLRREIKEIKVGANDAIVKFKNGSTIEAVASGESARGYEDSRFRQKYLNISGQNR